MYQIDYRTITTHEGGIWPWHLRSCYWAIVKCLFAKVPNALNRSRVHQFAMPYWWCEVVNYQNHPQKFVIFSTLNNFKPDFKLKKINFGIIFFKNILFIIYFFFMENSKTESGCEEKWIGGCTWGGKVTRYTEKSKKKSEYERESVLTSMSDMSPIPNQSASQVWGQWENLADRSVRNVVQGGWGSFWRDRVSWGGKEERFNVAVQECMPSNKMKVMKLTYCRNVCGRISRI